MTGDVNGLDMKAKDMYKRKFEMRVFVLVPIVIWEHLKPYPQCLIGGFFNLKHS